MSNRKGRTCGIVSAACIVGSIAAKILGHLISESMFSRVRHAGEDADVAASIDSATNVEAGFDIACIVLALIGTVMFVCFLVRRRKA